MRRIEDEDHAEVVGVTPDMTAAEAIEVIAEQVGAKVLLPGWDPEDGAVDPEEP